MNGHFREYMKATGVTSFFLFCIYLFHPILSPYVKSLGFDDIHLGILFAVFPLIQIFASPILGALSDRIGRKEVIMFGLGTEIVAIILFLFDTYKSLLYVARFCEAIAFAAVIYVGIALMEDHVKENTRGKFSGISLTIIQVGKLISPILGGFLADAFSIKAPFVLAMVLIWITLIVLAFYPHKHKHKKATIEDFKIWKEWKKFLSDRRLKGMAILGFFMHASIPLTLVFFPLHIIDKFGLTYKHVGYVTFAFTIFYLAQPVFGSFADKIGRWKAILLATAICGGSFIAMHYTQTYFTFMITVIIAGIGMAIWNVAATTYLSQIGEQIKMEGEILGVYISFAKIGDFLAMLGSGFLVAKYGIPALMTATGTGIIFASLVSVWFIKPKNYKHKEYYHKYESIDINKRGN